MLFSPASSLFQEMTWSYFHDCCTSDLRGGLMAESHIGRARGISWVVLGLFTVFFILKSYPAKIFPPLLGLCSMCDK